MTKPGYLCGKWVGTKEQWKVWIWGWRHAAVIVLMLGSIAWAAIVPEPCDKWLLYTGLMWQVVGMVCVVKAIAQARKRYGLPGYWRRADDHARRFPPRVQPVSLTIEARYKLTGDIRLNSGRAPIAAPEQSALEQRVNALENQLSTLTQYVDQHVQELGKHAKTASVCDEQTSLALVQVDRRVKHLEVGGLDMALVGTLALLAGVVTSTIAPDLCCRL